MAKPVFHGSDLEQIASYYKIPKEQIVSFGANVNPFGLPKSVRSILLEHLDVITKYPDRNYTELKAAIGKYCQADPAHVVAGNGCTELISLLIRSRTPKKAVVLGPTYSEYERELAYTGGIIEEYHLNKADDFHLNVPEFLNSLSEDTDLLILCNPNNPTSSVITCGQMQEILTHCRKQDIFVMIDETYIEFVSDLTGVSAVTLVPAFDNLIVLRGISKFFAAPGLRLGYGITSNSEFLACIKEDQNPWSVNSLAALAGKAIFEDTAYINQSRTLIQEERKRIYAELKSWSDIKVYPPGANFILVESLKEGLTASDAFETCIKNGLMIRDCSTFEALDGEFIRFCIMKPEENERLMQTLARLINEQ